MIDNNNRLLSRNEMYFLCLTESLHVLISVLIFCKKMPITCSFIRVTKSDKNLTIYICYFLPSFTFERNENFKQIQHLLEKYVKIKYYQEIQGLSKIAGYCRNNFIKME